MVFAASIALFGIACGEDALVGAWVECHDEPCVELDDEGMLFGEDGLAYLIGVDAELPLEEKTFCIGIHDPPFSWTRDGEALTVGRLGGQTEVWPIIVQDDIFDFRLENKQPERFHRINAEKRTGDCDPSRGF